jgi:hypothetical protein
MSNPASVAKSCLLPPLLGCYLVTISSKFGFLLASAASKHPASISEKLSESLIEGDF